MNKPLLIAIYILTLFTSCKKSSHEVPTNTISATIDGVNESFNTTAYAQLLTEDGQINSTMVITGSNKSAAESDIISSEISSKSTLTKGTYVNTSSSNVNSTGITYFKSSDRSTTPTIYASIMDGTPPSSITITSISNTNIQGTFNGQLVLADGSLVKSVTDGKFNVQIKLIAFNPLSQSRYPVHL